MGIFLLGDAFYGAGVDHGEDTLTQKLHRVKIGREPDLFGTSVGWVRSAFYETLLCEFIHMSPDGNLVHGHFICKFRLRASILLHKERDQRGLPPTHRHSPIVLTREQSPKFLKQSGKLQRFFYFFGVRPWRGHKNPSFGVVLAHALSIAPADGTWKIT